MLLHIQIGDIWSYNMILWLESYIDFRFIVPEIDGKNDDIRISLVLAHSTEIS